VAHLIMDTYYSNKSGTSKESEWSKRIDVHPATSSILRGFKFLTATCARLTSFWEDEIYANERKECGTTETKLRESPRGIMCNKSCNS
jgi:hypothetical protein